MSDNTLVDSDGLVPPDLNQCQAEKPNGNSFMTLGGRPGRVRCKNPPTHLVTETEPGEDGKTGGMSLCDDCLAVFKLQCAYMLDRVAITPIHTGD